MQATDSSAPAAPRACPIIDFVEVITGNVSGETIQPPGPGRHLLRIRPGCGQVTADRVDLFRIDRRDGHGRTDASLYPFRVRSRHAAPTPVPAAVDGAAEDLGVDASATSLCTLQALEVQNGRSAARNESTGRRTHRPRRLLRFVVMGTAQHAHRIEPGPIVVAGALGATTKHAFGQPRTDALEALDDRLGSRAAGAGVGRHLVAEGKESGHPSGNPAAHHLLDHRAAQPPRARPASTKGNELFAGRIQPADSRPDYGAGLPVHTVVSPDRVSPIPRPSRRRPRRCNRSDGSNSSRATRRAGSTPPRSRRRPRGIPPTVQPNFNSSSNGTWRIPDTPPRRASVYVSRPHPLGDTTPNPVTTTLACILASRHRSLIALPRRPEIVPAHTTVPSSRVMEASDRSLPRRKNIF